MSRKLFMFLIILALPAALWSFPGKCQFADTIIVSGNVGGQTWTEKNLYVMVGHTIVEPGTTLTINPGTIIWGAPAFSIYDPTESWVGALIVSRTATLNAIGTREKPIVFTAAGDNPCDPDDIAFGTRELWGGVVINGLADMNKTDSVDYIEGIPEEEQYFYYTTYSSATPNDNDNSGTIKYVSIRHGGFELGDANEINGLTMGCVGDGTTIDFVEVLNNKDDGFEWFGGTVNTKHLVAAAGNDDSFDYDVGFRGKGQFWFSWYDSVTGDKNGEWDGGTVPEDGTPYAIPTVYNFTFTGVGGPHIAGHVPGTKNNSFIALVDNAGGQFHNGLLTYGAKDAVIVGDEAGADSRQRLETGDMSFNNNLIWNFGDWAPGAANTILDVVNAQFVVDYFQNNVAWSSVSTNASGPTNFFDTDPQFSSMTWSDNAGAPLTATLQHAGLDPRPNAAGPAVTGALSPITDPFFTTANYKGAFGPFETQVNGDPKLANLWTRGWTSLWERGIHPFICGDFNYDDQVNILDVLGMIDWKFKGGRMGMPIRAFNINGVGGYNNANAINILDIIYLIDFKFKGGPAPACN